MAVRASMADLIARTRHLVGDVAGGGQVFTDQELQDRLDAHQTVVRYAELRAAATLAPGGAVSYLDYYADVGDWEDDETLVDGTSAPLTPATQDLLTGHWTFSTSRLPPVYVVGKHYDLYAAAADVLERWAAKVKLEFDFSADSQSFKRAQQRQALLELAAQYRRQARPRLAAQVRSDLAPAFWDTGGRW